MRPKPVRPTPSEKVVDYDDGDPYSCIAAGHQEERLQRALQDRVEQCFGKPAAALELLVNEDIDSVKTALYDIWTRACQTETGSDLARWAAEQLANLGDSSLADYDNS